MAAFTVHSDFEPKKIKSTTACTFPLFFCYEVLGLDVMILAYWMLSFKPTFSFFSFTLIKRLFSSSSLSAIKMVSSASLRLLIFLSANLILAYDPSSPAFSMMYCKYELNKQGDNIPPCHAPFPVLNQSVVPCPVLTVTWCCAYRFLRRQVRWYGVPILLRIFTVCWDPQSQRL